MKVRLFVSISAALLCVWLAATYVRVVPMHTYSSESAPADDVPMVQIEESTPEVELVVVDP